MDAKTGEFLQHLRQKGDQRWTHQEDKRWTHQEDWTNVEQEEEQDFPRQLIGDWRNYQRYKDVCGQGATIGVTPKRRHHTRPGNYTKKSGINVGHIKKKIGQQGAPRRNVGRTKRRRRPGFFLFNFGDRSGGTTGATTTTTRGTRTAQGSSSRPSESVVLRTFVAGELQVDDQT